MHSHAHCCCCPHCHNTRHSIAEGLQLQLQQLSAALMSACPARAAPPPAALVAHTQSRVHIMPGTPPSSALIYSCIASPCGTPRPRAPAAPCGLLTLQQQQQQRRRLAAVTYAQQQCTTGINRNYSGRCANNIIPSRHVSLDRAAAAAALSNSSTL
jgi:hypothetical protein